ncbi:MAG: hypothetical protein WAU07_02140 [Microgenomates group bacterium]
MEIVPIVFSVVLVVLAIVLSVVGIQVIMVLMEVKKTLTRVNSTIDMAEAKFQSFVQPLQSLGGAAAGLKTGLKVFETFVTWLKRDEK